MLSPKRIWMYNPCWLWDRQDHVCKSECSRLRPAMLNITLHSKSPWAVWVEQVCKSECSGMRPACAKHYVIARTSWHVQSWLIMLSTRRVGRSNPGWLCYRQDEFACKILVDHVLDKTRWNVTSWLIMLLARRVGMSNPGWLWDRQDELEYQTFVDCVIDNLIILSPKRIWM